MLAAGHRHRIAMQVVRHLEVWSDGAGLIEAVQYGALQIVHHGGWPRPSQAQPAGVEVTRIYLDWQLQRISIAVYSMRRRPQAPARRAVHPVLPTFLLIVRWRSELASQDPCRFSACVTQAGARGRRAEGPEVDCARARRLPCMLAPALLRQRAAGMRLEPALPVS